MQKLSIRRSLFWKLSLGFFLITCVAAASHSIISVKFWRSFNGRVLQWMNWEVADELARELRPLLREPSENGKAIVEHLVRFTLLNPGAEASVLDSEGNVRFSSHFGESVSGDPITTTRRIDIEPLEQFIDHKGFPREAIVSTHPGGAHVTESVFSAAPIAFGNEPGYLYVPLSNRRRLSGTQGIGDTSLMWGMTTLFFVTALLTTVAGIALFFILTRNIRKMTTVVHDFQRGDYSRRIDVKASDEIGQHASAFNSMADTIAKNIEQLKTNDALRRELIANVSHDVRTPFAVVQSQIESALIKVQQGDVETTHVLLENALQSCFNLTELLNDLFELSKISADGYQVDAEHIALGELSHDICERFRQSAEEKNIEFDVTIPEETLLIKGDFGMINRTISNLLENAIRYTRDSGRVGVTVGREGTEIVFSISDTGVGIAEDELPYIFDRYFRASSGKNESSDGTGLGLAIAKKTIDLHGGELQVESSLGEGTKFWFTLPEDKDLS